MQVHAAVMVARALVIEAGDGVHARVGSAVQITAISRAVLVADGLVEHLTEGGSADEKNTERGGEMAEHRRTPVVGRRKFITSHKAESAKRGGNRGKTIGCGRICENGETEPARRN